MFVFIYLMSVPYVLFIFLVALISGVCSVMSVEHATCACLRQHASPFISNVALVCLLLSIHCTLVAMCVYYPLGSHHVVLCNWSFYIHAVQSTQVVTVFVTAVNVSSEALSLVGHCISVQWVVAPNLCGAHGRSLVYC